MVLSAAEPAGYAVAPDGTKYRVPDQVALRRERLHLEAAVAAQRARGRSVVAVQGLGFVGVAVAAALAAARRPNGDACWFVIGVDLPRTDSFWKIGKLGQGLSPVASPDPELDRLLQDALCVTGNLHATATEAAYALADVIVVDMPLDVHDRVGSGPGQVRIHLSAFESAIRSIGRHMRADTLVLIETTVPIGATEKIVLPILEQERAARGLRAPVRLAYAYERVTPGPRYVDSIRRFWRVFAGVDAESTAAARAFLSSFIETDRFPLQEVQSPRAAELGKLLENSYRAANIAFIQEWTLLAERLGVNLFEVIDAIRVRAGTHDNIRQPGLGVGGYCLPKDSLLAQWSATELFGTDVTLDVTLRALKINHFMPEHAVNLLREMLDGKLAGRRIAICGVSYVPEVGDTRNTPTELLLDRLLEDGAEVVLHDPYLPSWPERPEQRIESDLAAALHGVDGIVLAVAHRPYRALGAASLVAGGRRAALVDAQNIVDDGTAEALRVAGWRVAGVGKGHWRTKEYQCPA